MFLLAHPICGSNVRTWPIASLRGNAVFRSLLGRSGHGL